MLGGLRVCQSMVKVQQPIMGAGQQQLGPLALHARTPGDKQPVPGQVFGKMFATRCHPIIGKTAHRPCVVAEPLGRFLDPLRLMASG